MCRSLALGVGLPSESYPGDAARLAGGHTGLVCFQV